KFKLFLETSLEDGADLIATGHYARVKDGRLLQAEDANKDQTYFLYRVTEKALEKTLFPLGNYTKPQVREMAKERGLYTAGKKDSQGICFVGQIGIREFLSQYVEQVAGPIIDKQTGKILGQHDGAIFYTIGQRHGLELGGGLPYYVVGKDMDKNEVYVTTEIQDDRLWSDQLNLTDVHWINGQPADGKHIQVRSRHRAPLINGTLHIASLEKNNAIYSVSTLHIALSDQIRALTPGQSAVIYDGEHVLGGGIIV